VLPAHAVIAAGQTLGQVVFVQPMNSLRLETQPREDGVLPTAIFRRVFISYRNRFAILEP
jgi:hypothetical protein